MYFILKDLIDIDICCVILNNRTVSRLISTNVILIILNTKAGRDVVSL
jgi:hypothetical protein